MASNDTLIDAAPRPPVTVDAVLDDAALAWQLCERNGPYEHVLMFAEFAASMQAYRDAAHLRFARRGRGGGRRTEFLTMPIYRGNWAFAGQPHIDGVDAVLPQRAADRGRAHGVRRRGRAPADRLLEPHRADAPEPQAHRRAHVPRRRTRSTIRRGS